MATIEKRERKSGTVYRAVVRIHGFPTQRKTFKRVTDAKMWVQQTEASIRTGEVQNIVRISRSKTLKDVITRYRNEVLAHKAASTQRAEKTYLDYWEEHLGSYGLGYLKPELISDKLKELTDAGDTRRKSDEEKPIKPKPKSRKTQKHYRDTLALVLKHAKQWGYIGMNPMESVNKITKLRNERIRFLTDDERRSVLDACKASDNKTLYPVVVFALATGARKGEILGLTTHDLDLERGVAILRDTKNGDTRSVPINGHLADLLKEQLNVAEEVYKKLHNSLPQSVTVKWLFPRSDGMAAMDIRAAWETAVETAGVSDFRFHDLRHSTASYLAMNGATLLEIAAVLGHRTLQMVKRYAHLSETHTASVVGRMNDKIFGSTRK